MMPDRLLGFSAVAFILSSVTTHVLSSNPHKSKSQSIWDSKWVVPRMDHQQKAVLSTDNTGFFAEASPSTGFPRPDTQIQCGAKGMTLAISKCGPTPLHVNQNGSWVALYHKVPQCGNPRSRQRRSWPIYPPYPPYPGCDLSKQGPATFPVRVAGTPLVVGCPYPPRSPTIDCSDGLQLRLGGASVLNLKVKVMGYWYPLMAVCRWCGLTIELAAGELSIKAPFKGYCTETKDGTHSLSLRLGDADMVFTCTPPPPPTFPPFPFPFPFPPHIHLPIPTTKPPFPFPWPGYPPQPKPWPSVVYPPVYPPVTYPVPTTPAPMPTAHTIQPSVANQAAFQWQPAPHPSHLFGQIPAGSITYGDNADGILGDGSDGTKDSYRR